MRREVQSARAIQAAGSVKMASLLYIYVGRFAIELIVEAVGGRLHWAR